MSSKTDFQNWVEEHMYDPEFLWAEFVMELSTLLQDEMEKQQISQSDLANKLGVDRSQVSRILNGKQNLTVKSLVEIAQALGMRLRVKGEPLRAIEQPTRGHVPLTVGSPLGTEALDTLEMAVSLYDGFGALEETKWMPENVAAGPASKFNAVLRNTKQSVTDQFAAHLYIAPKTLN